MASKAFGSARPELPHLVQPGGGLSGEINDLRNDIDDAFEVLEGASSATYPTIDMVDSASDLGLGGGDVVLRGANLLNSGTLAELDVDSTHGLIFYACAPGTGGNALTVQLISGAGTNVAFAAGALAITFNAGADDDNAIAIAVNGASSQARGYIRAVSSGTINAAGIVAAGAFAATNLAGATILPVESDWSCTVSGATALPVQATGTAPTAPITDTAVTVAIPDLTALSPARTAYDTHELFITANGVRSNGITLDAGIGASSGPILYAVDGEQPFDIDGDVLALVGANLLNQSVPASLDMDATHGLIFTATAPGVAGNSFTVELVSAAATAVVYAAGVLTIDFNDGVDDDDAIADAVNLAASQANGYIRAVSSGTINQAGMTAAGAFGPTAMTLGEGADWVCSVSGATALPSQTALAAPPAPVTATTARVTIPDLTALSPARTAADANAVYVTANGSRSNTMQLRSVAQSPGNLIYVDVDYAGSDNDGSFEKPYVGIQAAIDSASSGDSILVAPGTYTETASGLTLSPAVGVPIIGLCAPKSGGVTIVGPAAAVSAVTCTGVGVINFENIQFVDDGALANNTFDVTGATSTVVNLTGCIISATAAGARAVSMANTDAASALNLRNCLVVTNTANVSPVVTVQSRGLNLFDCDIVHGSNVQSSITYLGTGGAVGTTSIVRDCRLTGDVDVQAAAHDPDVTLMNTSVTTGALAAVINAGATSVKVFDCVITSGHANVAFDGAGSVTLNSGTVCLSTGDEVDAGTNMINAARPGFDHGRVAVAGASPQTIACTFNRLQPDTDYTAMITFEDNAGAVDLYYHIVDGSKTTADFDVTITSVAAGAIDGIVNWNINHD